MFRRVGVVLISGVLLSSIITVAVPNSALAYTYKGNCNSLGTTTTWDDLADSRSNVSGVEMDQYAIPGSSSWVTCTYAGSSGFGHMMELDSLQGSGDQIVQIGIGKFVSSGGTSWLFMYTPDDSSDGTIVNAASLFGENPVAGRTYWMHILSYHEGQTWYWEYCLKDFATSHEACWDTTAHWHVGTYSWFGGETADQNDTMGARPEATTFRTYALRVHDLTSGWQAYANDTFVIDNCTQGGTNRYMVNCNVQDTNGYGAFFLWNQ